MSRFDPAKDSQRPVAYLRKREIYFDQERSIVATVVKFHDE
jgi:hypothetical protein